MNILIIAVIFAFLFIGIVIGLTIWGYIVDRNFRKELIKKIKARGPIGTLDTNTGKITYFAKKE
jgi:ABC-type lipoprotein release transport system permease subunit